MTITVAAIEGRLDNAPACRAIFNTAACVPFHTRRLLLSPAAPEAPDAWNIEWNPIPDFGPKSPTVDEALSRLCLFHLPKIIDTDFLILVQADGYALHPHAWTNRFLDYDFIGPPWMLWISLATFLPRLRFPHRVVSGGFTLRSRRWLHACLSLPPYSGLGEDVFMALHRNHFSRLGCLVAPLPLALHWAIELPLEDHPLWNPMDSFGFHGLQKRDPFHRLGYAHAVAIGWRKSRLYQKLCRKKLKYS